MNEDALYYVGQKAFIKKGEEVLILLKNNTLREPGGKVKAGEDLVESLKREVKEETGLEVTVGEPFATWTYLYNGNHPLSGSNLFLVGYKCEYVSGDVVLNEEHDGFDWVNKDNYTKYKENSEAYRILTKYFSDK